MNAQLGSKIVWISTTRYSVFFRRLLQEYARDATAVVDLQPFRAEEFPQLIDSWCTNAKIMATREFRLVRDGRELFGFHDHPEELWADASELPFLERLASEGVIRCRAYTIRPGMPMWLQTSIAIAILIAVFWFIHFVL